MPWVIPVPIQSQGDGTLTNQDEGGVKLFCKLGGYAKVNFNHLFPLKIGNIFGCSPSTDVYLCEQSVSMVNCFCLSVHLIIALPRLVENVVLVKCQ